jgi:signal peptidase I
VGDGHRHDEGHEGVERKGRGKEREGGKEEDHQVVDVETRDEARDRSEGDSEEEEGEDLQHGCSEGGKGLKIFAISGILRTGRKVDGEKGEFITRGGGNHMNAMPRRGFSLLIPILSLSVLLLGCTQAPQLFEDREMQDEHDAGTRLDREGGAMDEEGGESPVASEETFLRLPREIPTSPSVSGISVLGTQGGLVIKVRDIEVWDVADTRSMIPSLGAGHATLVTRRFHPETLQVGNIVAYRASFTNASVVHRIVEVRPTSEGVCYIVQGDNVATPDPGCVAPSQIEGLVIGVLFDRVSQEYTVCDEDTYGIIQDNEFRCLPKRIETGIYTPDQPLASPFRYPLCAESHPDRPYTVVTPQGAVLCYETIR